jgi:hypothetical protein
VPVHAPLQKSYASFASVIIFLFSSVIATAQSTSITLSPPPYQVGKPLQLSIIVDVPDPALVSINTHSLTGSFETAASSSHVDVERAGQNSVVRRSVFSWTLVPLREGKLAVGPFPAFVEGRNGGRGSTFMLYCPPVTVEEAPPASFERFVWQPAQPRVRVGEAAVVLLMGPAGGRQPPDLRCAPPREALVEAGSLTPAEKKAGAVYKLIITVLFMPHGGRITFPQRTFSMEGRDCSVPELDIIVLK